jgi:hypothetical protein
MWHEWVDEMQQAAQDVAMAKIEKEERQKMLSRERKHAQHVCAKAAVRVQWFKLYCSLILSYQAGSSQLSQTINNTLHTCAAPTTFSHSMAEASSPYCGFQEAQSKGSSNGWKRKLEKVPTDAVWTNWQHPFLWSQILQAAVHVGYSMSPIAIATHLKQRDPVQFALRWSGHGLITTARNPYGSQRFFKGRSTETGHLEMSHAQTYSPHTLRLSLGL